MASTLWTRGSSAAAVCLALSLGVGPARTLAQSAQQQDQQYQQQQDQSPPPYPPPPPQDQGSQQDQQQDQGPPPYPPQDQGAAPEAGAQQQGSVDFPPQGPAQSPSSVARVSFVQGDVKMMSAGQTDFQQAVANMPLVANTSLQTGQDGEAEVEFADGSVARITPNSSLALNQIGQDSIQMQQNSGLVYYELNVVQGHPPFRVEFPNAEVVPAANAVFRMDLDSVPEVAVMTGSVNISGSAIIPTTVNENQTLRFQAGNGQPYTIAQSITPDSWDQWNQDRDQAISQEAAQQTPARDNVGDSGDENWNDLDAYGNWYPVQGSDVWVPAGVDAGWDPYGYGYWGYYPGFGSTYISGYPWGWLPYHCGAWNYYSFGWGWRPGGCGSAWFPVAGVRGYRGYFLPGRPVFRAGLGFGGNRFVMVNRGPAARGPWGAGHPVPSINHDARLNFGGREVTPLGRTAFNAQAGGGARGTSPGVRAALRSPGGESFRSGGAQDRQAAPNFNRQENRMTAPRSDSRNGYTPRSTPTPHYSGAPAYHYSAPRGGGGGRGHR